MIDMESSLNPQIHNCFSSTLDFTLDIQFYILIFSNDAVNKTKSHTSSFVKLYLAASR